MVMRGACAGCNDGTRVGSNQDISASTTEPHPAACVDAARVQLADASSTNAALLASGSQPCNEHFYLPDLGFSIDGMAAFDDSKETSPVPDCGSVMVMASQPPMLPQNAMARDTPCPPAGPPGFPCGASLAQTGVPPMPFPDLCQPPMGIGFGTPQHAYGSPHLLSSPWKGAPSRPALGIPEPTLPQLPGCDADKVVLPRQPSQGLGRFQGQDAPLDLGSASFGRHGLIGTRVVPAPRTTPPRAPPGFGFHAALEAIAADQWGQHWGHQAAQPQAQPSAGLGLGLLDAGFQVDAPAARPPLVAQEPLQPLSNLLCYHLGLLNQVRRSIMHPPATFVQCTAKATQQGWTNCWQ